METQQCPNCFVPMVQQGVYMLCTTSSCEVRVVARTVAFHSGDEQRLGDIIEVPKEFFESHSHIDK